MIATLLGFVGSSYLEYVKPWPADDFRIVGRD
jgi:hypothetical protein